MIGGIIIKKIFFDTETTGLDCNDCQIIELAMITVIGGEIVEEYDEFIKIDGVLPQKISEITGITDKMLENEGLPEEKVALDLKERITENTLMIAHNCQFDLSFVYQLLKRHFPFEAYEIVRNADWLDTLTVLKDRKDYPHRLNNAVDRYKDEEFDDYEEVYNLNELNFHRAIDDTKALFEVYHKLKADLKKEYDMDILRYKNLFGFIPKWEPEEDEKFDFIDYVKQPYHNRGCLLPEKKLLPNIYRG